MAPPALNPARILVIRPSALGDVARSVPVLAALKQAWPAAAIDWVVESGFEAVIDQHPALGKAISFPKKAIRDSARRLQFGPLLSFRRVLRNGAYDLVLDCQGLGRSAAMARSTGAPRRFGHADAREFGWLAYTTRVPTSVETHTVDRMLTLAAAAGAPAPEPDLRLYSSPEARAWLAEQEWASAPFVVLAPTSRWPAKQWPSTRFAGLAAALADAGLRVVFTGSASERDQVQPCLAVAGTKCGVIDAVGTLSLAQLMAVIERSSLVVANDSAALHIAVGFDRPIVALFGPTRVHRVGPYRREADVIQHITDSDPLEHKRSENVALMERISLEEVLQACAARLP